MAADGEVAEDGAGDAFGEGLTGFEGDALVVAAVEDGGGDRDVEEEGEEVGFGHGALRALEAVGADRTELLAPDGGRLAGRGDFAGGGVVAGRRVASCYKGVVDGGLRLGGAGELLEVGGAVDQEERVDALLAVVAEVGEGGGDAHRPAGEAELVVALGLDEGVEVGGEDVEVVVLDAGGDGGGGATAVVEADDVVAVGKRLELASPDTRVSLEAVHEEDGGAGLAAMLGARFVPEEPLSVDFDEGHGSLPPRVCESRG